MLANLLGSLRFKPLGQLVVLVFALRVFLFFFFAQHRLVFLINQSALIVYVHDFSVFAYCFSYLCAEIPQVLVDYKAWVLLLLDNPWNKLLVLLVLMGKLARLLLMLLCFKLPFLLHQVFDHFLEWRLVLLILCLDFRLSHGVSIQGRLRSLGSQRLVGPSL